MRELSIPGQGQTQTPSTEDTPKPAETVDAQTLFTQTDPSPETSVGYNQVYDGD